MSPSEQIADLIQTLLGAIRGQFYADRTREFMRDSHALRQAIARYGAECSMRGWQFNPQFVLKDILELLNAVKRQGTESVQYLPKYLEGAIDRHVKLRAEKLHEEARDPANLCLGITRKISPVQVVQERSPMEILGLVYGAEKKTHDAKLKARQKVVEKPTHEEEPRLL